MDLETLDALANAFRAEGERRMKEADSRLDEKSIDAARLHGSAAYTMNSIGLALRSAHDELKAKRDER